MVFVGGPVHGKVAAYDEPPNAVVMLQPFATGPDSSTWDYSFHAREIVYRRTRVFEVGIRSGRHIPIPLWRVREQVWSVMLAQTVPYGPDSAAVAIELCRAEHVEPEREFERDPTPAELRQEAARLALRTASDPLDEREDDREPRRDR